MARHCGRDARATTVPTACWQIVARPASAAMPGASPPRLSLAVARRLEHRHTRAGGDARATTVLAAGWQIVARPPSAAMRPALGRAGVSPRLLFAVARRPEHRNTRPGGDARPLRARRPRHYQPATVCAGPSPAYNPTHASRSPDGGNAVLRRYAVAALLLLALLPGLCAAAEEDLTGQQVYHRFTNDHPRLFFRAADLPAVRERCATFQQAAYASLKARVDAELDSPGSFPNCAETALVYLVSGDAKYAEAGRRKLLAGTAYLRQNAADMTSWTRASTDARRYIYLAADWLWQAMTPAERKQVSDDLVAVAREWLSDSPAWLRNAYMGGYNQWSNAFLCGALLAKSGGAADDVPTPTRASCSSSAMTSTWNCTMKARLQMAQDDGGIISGYNYAVYNYLKMDLDFLLVMKNAAGADLFARDYMLRGAGIWFAYGMHMPWRLPKIADAGDGLRDFDSGSAVFCLGACAAIYHDPVAQKLAAELVGSPNSPPRRRLSRPGASALRPAPAGRAARRHLPARPPLRGPRPRLHADRVDARRHARRLLLRRLPGQPHAQRRRLVPHLPRRRAGGGHQGPHLHDAQPQYLPAAPTGD